MASKIKDLPFIPSDAKAFIVKRVENSGVASGVIAAKNWVTVPTNTVEGDTTLASVSSNTITIQPGTYVVKGFIETSAATGLSSVRLYDTTNSASVLYGNNNTADSGSYPFSLYGILTVSEPTDYEPQIYKATSATQGGLPSGYGVDEVYVIIMFIRI